MERDRRRPSKSAVYAAAMLAMFALTPASQADPVDDLAAALGMFGGVGHASVERYRVALTLPEDESANGTKLVEIWRAPSDLVLRAEDPATPGAMVRSLALYLEPVYVARTAILDLDWSALAADVRKNAVVKSHPEAGGRRVLIDLPDSSSSLPEAFHDVALLDAALDARGRLRTLDVKLTKEGGTVSVACDYAGRDVPQPVEARWTLPSGEVVLVRTKFRQEQKLLLPAERRVTFPSRFDPKEKEEIVVSYGKYELDPALPDSIWTGRGSFRFDANGLVN